MENETLKCQQCDVHACKLLTVGKKQVCRYCKKDYIKHGKFTRSKVKHDYVAAYEYVKQVHKTRAKSSS